nr:GNAT family N-acetyltransferase [Staphylococcus saccharolyticus]
MKSKSDKELYKVEELRQLTYKDEKAYIQYIQEWYDNDEKVIPTTTNLKEYHSFKDMVDYINKEKPDKDWVPTTTLFYMIDENIVGALEIRHELNRRLSNIGGHVGYGVAQSYRGKGYAHILLGEALVYLKKLNVKKVRLTTNPFNFASQKVIKDYEGYEIEPYIKKNGRKVNRYEILSE